LWVNCWYCLVGVGQPRAAAGRSGMALGTQKWCDSCVRDGPLELAGLVSHQDALKGSVAMRKAAIAALATLAASTAFTAQAMLFAPPAQAACTTTIAVGNVFVSSTKTENVVGKWTKQCTATTASWNMQGGPAYGHYAGGWNFSSGTTTTTAYFDPTIDPLGAYEAMPAGAYDPGFNAIPQNTVYFSVRLASNVVVSGHRSGNYVFVRAYVKRFSTSMDSGLGGWEAWPDRQVTFASWHGGWKPAGSKWTISTGFTRYLKLYAPSKRSFRASVKATSIIWGDTSKAFRS
jgi:hypothetical protein